MTEKKKYKGGRPRKENTRNKRVEIRLTEKEYSTLEEKSIRLNCSISELLRGASLNIKVLEKRDPKEVLDAKMELRKMGANINQIARKLNHNTQQSSIFMKKDIQDIKDKISDLLEKL